MSERDFFVVLPYCNMLLVTKTSTRYKVLRTVCHCGSACVVAKLPCAAFNFFNLFTFLLTKFQKCLTYYLSLTGCLNTSSDYRLFRLPCKNTARRCLQPASFVLSCFELCLRLLLCKNLYGLVFFLDSRFTGILAFCAISIDLFKKVNNFKYFSIFSLNNALLCKMSKSCLISRF